MHAPACTCRDCFARAFERNVRRLARLAGLRVRRPAPVVEVVLTIARRSAA